MGRRKIEANAIELADSGRRGGRFAASKRTPQTVVGVELGVEEASSRAELDASRRWVEARRWKPGWA